MEFNGSKNAIIHHLGEISATQSIIVQTLHEHGRELRAHSLQLDRLERGKSSRPAFWETDKFWLVVGAAGASLMGMPDLAKLLMPH